MLIFATLFSVLLPSWVHRQRTKTTAIRTSHCFSHIWIAKVKLHEELALIFLVFACDCLILYVFISIIVIFFSLRVASMTEMVIKSMITQQNTEHRWGKIKQRCSCHLKGKFQQYKFPYLFFVYQIYLQFAIFISQIFNVLRN